MNLGRPLLTYSAEVLSRTSKEAALKLEKAINGTIVFRNFEDSFIDLKSFDWKKGPENRNWWWQLQQFPFVSWYTQSIQTHTEAGRHEEALDFIHQSVSRWRECEAKYQSKSPLIWHDHATAFRLRGLADLYTALHGMETHVEDLKNLISDEIERHVNWLLLEKNYSRRTNHGFDQSDILLRACLIFPNCDGLAQARNISRERLKDEISFSFTDQGAHKENSPGYHQYMMTRLKSLSAYKELGDDELAATGEIVLENAKRFLKAITLPDGTLPIIGDTLGGEKANPDNLPSSDVVPEPIANGEYRIWDFADSGYVIIEYTDQQTKTNAKLIVRSGQLSHYHRHDDDLSIYWQIGDQLILGDGGLYSHNEKDPKRIFLRSPLAHNTVYVAGMNAERKTKLLLRRGQLQVKASPNRIVAVTHCYKGWKLRRVVNFEGLSKGSLLIEDQASSEVGTATIVSNWIRPAGHGNLSKTSPRECDFQLNRGFNLNISSLNSPSGIEQYVGWNENMESSAILSKIFGQEDQAMRAAIYWSGPGRHQTRLTLSSTEQRKIRTQEDIRSK